MDKIPYDATRNSLYRPGKAYNFFNSAFYRQTTSETGRAVFYLPIL